LPTAGKFEALEVINGYWTRDDAIGNLVADWFYLLGQGYKVSALGSSDTHKINWVRAGFPRTWLRLPNDRPGETTGAALADAIRNQRAIASTGPFALLTVDGAQIGDTVVPAIAGQVTLQLTVDAPAWMEVDTVRVFVNGVKTHTLEVTPGQRPLFAATLVEPLSRDSWIVLQASGSQPLPGDVVGEFSAANGYQMLPWVITNPIFVDADGNGQWQPPAWNGTPAPLSMPAFVPLPARGAPSVVPPECDPTIPPGTFEPPLDAHGPLERYLMPLLYP
jgi:hypothetical protein